MACQTYQVSIGGISLLTCRVCMFMHARTDRASARDHQALVDEEHLCCPKLPCSVPGYSSGSNSFAVSILSIQKLLDHLMYEAAAK